MTIDLLSFIFGMILAIAGVIVFETIWGKLFANKQTRELRKEVHRLRTALRKKDEYVRKALSKLQEETNEE